MADPAQASSVFRYLDLADSFVRILLSDSDTLVIDGRPSLNMASYRRLIIETCMPDFGGDLDHALDTLFPDDPQIVEDLLYQLCIEVNPNLDIHEVRLCADPQVSRAGEAQVTSQKELQRKQLPADPLKHLRSRARGLEGRLARDVIGQPQAVSAVVRAVRRAAAGLSEPARPLASLLFSGRTGTGKTQLARTLARALHGDAPRSLLRIDCSEYAAGHEYAKLIGAPPGYVGHEGGGWLTTAIEANPDCIVLFDEVEKAHPRMHNLLLQLLEEGCMTDGKGQRIDFRRAIVILTTNCGAEEVRGAGRALGFERNRVLGRESLEAITEEALEGSFPPELLGRIDDIVIFDELGPAEAELIAARQLFELALRARDRGRLLAFTPAVARWVAKRGYSPEYGARELKRVIQREVESRLSDLLIDGDLRHDQLLRTRVRKGELVFEVED